MTRNLLLLAVVVFPVRAAEPPEAVEFFEKKVRPVLVEHCYQCHSSKPKTPKGGLRVDGREFLLKGGDSGAALVPDKPEKSKLLEAISYRNVDLQMPPKAKLSEPAIADLTRWVRMGAPWPKDPGPGVTKPDRLDLAQRKREHWAWRPVQPHGVPVVKDRAWVRDASDAFILAKLEEKGLKPAPVVEKRTWLRRVYFDLVGLPPSPEEIEAFVSDAKPQATERVVARLLESPHFGERWARHWLDLVRYGESRGHEFEPIIPNAYQYRDYVIRALNADVPYNQFVHEHLAGDLLAQPRRHPKDGFNESILGTGFWFLGEEVHSPVDIRQDQADRFDNRLDVMTKTFLGLTVSCARCHDHKFDAISTKDYYSLFGFLSSSSYRLARFDSLDRNRSVAADLATLRAKARSALGKALAAEVKPLAERLPEYLLAAREIMQDAKATVEAVAAARKLDAALLSGWVTVLRNAAKDREDPLHAWALLCTAPAALEKLPDLAEELRKRDAGLKNAQVIIDFATSDPATWLPDDASFGLGAAHPGDVRLTGGVRFAERAAAEYDRVFDVLKVAPGAENDPGALGRIPMRAGRTIRTPSFKVAGGKVHYLVRGAGAAYAAVSAHAVVEGPLHGQLVTRFPAGKDFRWHTQDLTRYKGLDAHVEFTAAPGSDFAVALVVQTEQSPGVVPRPARQLAKLLTAQSKSPESLAAGYGKLFAEASRRLAADEVIGKDDSAEVARLAAWLTARPELLGDRGKSLAAGLEPFLAEEKKLAGGIVASSRLAPAMLDGTGVDERVFIRGSPKVEGEPAPRRLLEALTGANPLAPARGSGRLELARQITDPEVNPFVARVLVNRVWHHLFGRGIVGSVDNFGLLGELPTHPELLDFLATRFVKEGWSLKTLIRELILSNTYAMSSQPSAEGEKVDPTNLLLHRMRLRRLEGEAIRDAILTVSGRLDRTMHGPSVPIYLTPFLDGRGRPGSGPLDGNGRRSLYLSVKRNFLSPLLLAFDTPSPFSTVGRRTVSNVPAQALILMNDPFVHQQAALWGKKVLASAGTTSDRVARMYLSAFGRPPGDEERKACETFLGRQAALHGGKLDDPRVWTDLAHTLINVKEFIFVE